MPLRSRLPTVGGEDRPHQPLALPAQPGVAGSPAAAAEEGRPFGRITTLARRLLEAPVAFAALETAPPARWPDIRIAVPGARIAGRYRLDDRMHDTVPAEWTQGSQLWKATDDILARRVVVRILPPGFARTGEVLAAAGAASRLSDPRLARIFDACEGDDGAYIITEWPSGEHLADLLAAGPLSCAQAAALIADAAGALAAAHAAGVSHLCLTPRSLLWNATTGAKIIGLGIDAALAGVPPADGQGLADARGLASLLYAALTAHWPGQHGRTLPPAPQRTGHAYPPRHVRAGVPKQLDMVVCRALFGQVRRGHPPIVTPAQMASALSAAPTQTWRPHTRPTPQTPKITLAGVL
jgi:hypothetical protein